MLQVGLAGSRGRGRFILGLCTLHQPRKMGRYGVYREIVCVGESVSGETTMRVLQYH